MPSEHRSRPLLSDMQRHAFLHWSFRGIVSLVWSIQGGFSPCYVSLMGSTYFHFSTMNYFWHISECPCPDPLSGGDFLDEVAVSRALGSRHLCVLAAGVLLLSRCRQLATASFSSDLLALCKAIGALYLWESAAFTELLLFRWGSVAYFPRVLPAQLFMSLCSLAECLVFASMQISSPGGVW